MAMFLARIKRALASLTPSNASPATITSGEGYQATAGGYAIESCTDITPDNSLTPSIVSGTIYRALDSGVAIKRYSSLTPPSDPEILTQGNIYKIVNRSGYAIASYSSKTPDDTNPPAVSHGDIIRITGFSGYLYKTQQSGGSMTVEQYSYTNGTTRTCTMKNGVYFTSRTDSAQYASYLKGYIKDGVNTIIINNGSGSTVSYNTSTHQLSCTKGTTSQGTNDIYFFIFN